MREINNSQEFRENITRYVNKYIKNEKLSKNLEKGIFNFTIQQADEKKILKKWSNPYFVLLYKNRLRSVYANLNNTELLDKIKKKQIRPHEVAFMTHQDMDPEKWKILLEIKKLHEENLYSPKIDANTDDFTCRKCKSKKCTYYQLQTRSADEPMTTFVTCIDCGNRWKC
tara:strand:+ start:368 stop:877 length:510 start_codon:yes stop_codon:yes gene_type:complete